MKLDHLKASVDSVLANPEIQEAFKAYPAIRQK
jgi:hypothetical protein